MNGERDGVISGLRLHDAVVVAFAFSEDKNFRLKMRREDDSFVNLELHGIHEWNLQIWGLGIIIFDISQWKLDDAPTTAWNDLFVTRGAGYTANPKLLDVEKHVRELKHRAPNSYLLSFCTSYGASSLTVVCDSIRFYDESK